MKLLPVLLGLALLSAGGCTMAPTYERPEAPVPFEFPDYPEYQGVGSDGRQPDSSRIGALAPGTAITEDGRRADQGQAANADAEQSARENAWNGSLAGSAPDGTGTDLSTRYAINGQTPLGRAEQARTEQAGQPGSKTAVSGPVRVDFDEIPAAGNLTWREFFTDPGLRRVIGLALENNRDLRVALLNIERSRAQYEIQRADLLPSIEASGTNSNQRMPSNATGLPEYIERRSAATVGFTSYELDLFGRVRSLKDAALESYLQVTQNALSVQVSLVAEVASAYLTLVSYKELYALTENTYQTRMKTLELSQAMFDQGLSSQLVLNQARTALEEARVAAAEYRTSMLQYENALALLIGGHLPPDLVIPNRLAEVQTLRDVPQGLPSYLLTRRPDILAAEHTLRSANANIGAARASFFPRISLTGNLGYMSADMDSLFGGNSRTWSFMPSISIPIFEGGRLLANLRVSEADKSIAISSYEKAIQTAFREVADALAFRSTSHERMAAATALVEASKQSFDLSNIRYEVGVDSFLNVLDSQRTYFSAQQAYVNTKLALEMNTLNLYKALGGGWE